MIATVSKDVLIIKENSTIFTLEYLTLLISDKYEIHIVVIDEHPQLQKIHKSLFHDSTMLIVVTIPLWHSRLS